MEKQKYYAASFSGGKDSTAMVLHLIERGDPLDEVIFCDTTAEFPAMIRHVERVKREIENAGIKFTTLRNDHDFEYYLAEMNVTDRKPTAKHYGVPGYGWSSHKARWCTRHLKTDLVKKHLRDLQKLYDLIQYVGIAADEDYRLQRAHNQDASHRHPLREWGWTEDQALQYCYDRGYDWEQLYEIFRNKKTGKSKVSCWLCPLQSYDSLRSLRKHFPILWQELRELDKKQWQTFAHGYSVNDFERRFELEDRLIAAGHKTNNRQFFVDLEKLLTQKSTIDELLHARFIEK